MKILASNTYPFPLIDGYLSRDRLIEDGEFAGKYLEWSDPLESASFVEGLGLMFRFDRDETRVTQACRFAPLSFRSRSLSR